MFKKIFLRLAVISTVLIFLAVNLVVFKVDETESAVVLQFGNPVQIITEPGLKLKLPDPIQNVRLLDKRLQVYIPDTMEFLTLDKKDIIIESFVTWQISDPIIFIKAVKDEIGAEQRLRDVILSEFGVILGQYDLSALISSEGEKMKLTKVMLEMTAKCEGKMKSYGMKIADVRIRSITFPEKNMQSVFNRMKTERERIARKYRAEGSEEAVKIRAEAEKQQKIIISEGYKKAETIKGEGDAQSLSIYAKAYGADPEFYKFIRTLETYEKIIDDKTTFILPSDSELLKYLNK